MKIEKFNSKRLMKELKAFFSAKELEQIARETKFKQRSTSKLSGLSFLMLNVFDISDGKERSLNDSCDWLGEHFGISMTKQSLDERYNTDAVRFIKTCFKKVLISLQSKALNQSLKSLPFAKIELTDSTSFKIPLNLSHFYKGLKGNGREAMIKIHCAYDLLRGEVRDITLTDGSCPDSMFNHEELSFESKGLYIRDLGYLDIAHLNKISNSGAYFLSRSKTNAAYSIKDKNGKFKRIELTEYLPDEGKTRAIDNLYIGHTKMKTKIRLIIQALPKEIREKREKKLQVYISNNKRHNVSEQKKAMCAYNIFMTNTTEKLLPKKLIQLVYSLRWQIELLFKIWKSVFKIDKVKKMSIFRFECYIYSKLIAILLTLHINDRISEFLWEEYGFELSPIKAAKVIKKNG